MADWIAPTLGLLGAAITAVLGPMATAGLQNRRVHLLRSSISGNVALRKTLDESNVPISQYEKAKLDQLINEQVSNLIVQDRKWLSRKRDWNMLVGVLAILVAPYILVASLMWRLDKWWSWSILVSLGVMVLIFVIYSLHAAFHPQEEDARDSSESTEKQG